MRKAFTTAVLAVGLVVTGGAWLHFHAATDSPRLTLFPVTRGDVTQTVNCTGEVASPTTVDVGSQVSGTIQWLGADFNSIVHKGDVLARLDPTVFEIQVNAATANLAKARADADGARAALEDSLRQAGRARELAAHQVITESDLSDAEVALKEAQAQVRLAEADVAQAAGALDQAKVDLAHTVITSPVDGIVLDRKVDVGQTVAAGFQAPSLFSVAADLTKIELMADVDEADIGNVRAGEPARFHVDAYPGRDFAGTVSQVRLRPTVDLMAVTYQVVVAFDNPELLLRPGMSATIEFVAARRGHVLRVPAQALRFRPTFELLGALGEQALDKSVTRVPAFIAPGQRAEVWVSRQGRLERRMVTVGVSDGTYTEVLDGLNEGALVTTAARLP